ncbi:MAG: YceD family protein [Acidimicrobiia bacterium]|nr:YceD family protein [Acidimicrobiia bacterium]
MHPTPFMLDVGDLLTHPGDTRSVEFGGAIEAEVEQARLLGPVEVAGRLEGLSDGVYLVAQVEAPASLTCNRCLTDWEEELAVEVRQLFAREPDEDGYGIREHWIDTEGPVRDELVLALPLAPVCRDDCQGICASCGADLNTDPCQGHDQAESSPFAGLKDLLSD